MSIQQNFPAISPSLNLNFARSKTLDPRITFSRTSTATRVNEQGLVEVVSADIPRFDHKYDASTGVIKSLGLLVEESRSNSLYYSNDFSQTNWTKQTSHPVPTQSVVGPDGVSNSGWRFYRTATNQYIYQSVAGAGTHTLSAWVRSSAATGSFTMQGYNSTDNGMSQQFTATNEWQRFSITISPTTTTNYYPCIPTNINTDFYVWGAQLELNKSFETSYIPTSGGTATRNPDNVTMTGDNFSDWYNPNEGTVYADTRMVGVQTGRYDRLWSITNSNLNVEGISVFVAGPNASAGGSGYLPSITITNSATEQVSGVIVETALTTPQLKSAFAFKQNNCASSYNGQERFVDNIVDLSTFTTPPDRLLIGQPQRFQGYSCMTVSQLTYYPVRLPNSTLQTLTK